MRRRQYVNRRRSAPQSPAVRTTQHVKEASSIAAGGCAGGNRGSGGAPGNGPGQDASLLDSVLGPQAVWEAPALPLSPEQIGWLTHEDLVTLLQCFSCRLADVHQFLSEFAYGSRFDAHNLRAFFQNDYMQCMALLSELDFRMNKL